MKKKAKKLTAQAVIFLLAALALCYIGVQGFIIWHNPYETVLAESSTLSDSVTCRGAMGMSETDVVYDGSGVLNYLLENGSRVSAGTVVAQAFSTYEEARNSAYLSRIEEKLSILEKSDVTAEETDVSLLYKQLRNASNEVLDILASGDLSDLRSVRDTLELAANKVKHAAGNDDDFSARKAVLEEQKAALSVLPLSEVTAPSAGYFVAADESAKRLYTTEELRAMTPQQLADAVAQESPQNDANVAGKVISDYQWYFFASVDTSIEKFVEGTSVQISFPDSGTESYPATIVSVEINEDNTLAKVELVCDYTSGDVLSLEHTEAVITFKTYEGLKIPKTAIRIVDDQRGVYVKNGNIALFRVVTPIYENVTDILVPVETESGVNEVKLYDSVIVSGRVLYDGKIVS